ncbi:MAG: HAD family hydrolase [Nanoarchaeota archaeon]
MIKAIIFDMDDTLYEEQQFVMSGFRAVSEHLAAKYNLDCSNIFKILKHDFENGIRKKNFNILLKKLKLNESLDHLIRIYREHIPKISLCPDAEQILKIYKGKLKLGLLTDGHIKTQNNKINSLDIRKYFDVIVINDITKGVSKANKEVFVKTLSMLKIKSENTLFIGDNPLKDFIGASQAGIISIRINRGSGEYDKLVGDQADFTISTLLDIPKIIEKITER